VPGHSYSYPSPVWGVGAGRVRERAVASPDSALLDALARQLVDAAIATRRGEAILIRSQAALLWWLDSDSRLRLCGFTTLGDLASEILGLRPRTVRERLRFHRLCSRIPAVEHAFFSGALSQCQILAIEPALSVENADSWLAAAVTCSVRELRWKVRRALKNEGISFPEGRMVGFTAPVAFQPVFNEMIELARCVLGRDAPRHECIAAVLAEAGIAGDVHQEHVTPPPRVGSLRPDPFAIAPPEAIEDARQTLDEVREHVQSLFDLIESGEPKDPMEALVRLQQIAILRAPQKVLFARLLRDLRRTRAIDRLGYRSVRDFVEEKLGLSERSARNRMAEAILFEGNAEIEEAVGTGRLTIMQAHWIRRMGRSGNYAEFATRARAVTRRQFDRECRLYELLRACGLTELTRRPLPQPGMEAAVVAKLGWTQERVDEELAGRGVAASPQESSQDPAENPIVMERLEALAEMLALSQWDEVPRIGSDMPPSARLSSDLSVVSRARPGMEGQVSASDVPRGDGLVQELLSAGRQMSAVYSRFPVDPDAQVAIRFWAPHAVADDFWYAIEQIRRTAGADAGPPALTGVGTDAGEATTAATDPVIPVWAAAVILFARVAAIWRKEDPASRPARSKILRRDRYHCVIPGCSSRRMLTKHHTRFRSQGGGNEAENLSTVCHPHHAHGIHEGNVRLTGPSPHGRHFELGCRLRGGPLLILHGQRIVKGPWE
jgi:hypothetical protein